MRITEKEWNKEIDTVLNMLHEHPQRESIEKFMQDAKLPKDHGGFGWASVEKIKDVEVLTLIRSILYPRGYSAVFMHAIIASAFEKFQNKERSAG